MKNRFSALSYTLYGLIYVSLFVFMGVFNLAFAKWDTSIIGSVEYWITTASSTALYLLAFTNTVGLSVDIKKSTDPTHIEMEALITKLSRKVISHNFREFIDGFNWKTKRRLWKEVYENKYTMFNNRLPYSVHVEMKTKEKDEWSKRTIHYDKKRQKIEQYINDTWIDENVRYIKFRYPFITPQEVRTGEVKPVNNKRLLNTNVLGKAVSKRIGIMFLAVIFNALLSALVWTDSPLNISVLLQILLQLFLILLNVGFGLREGEAQFKEVVMNNLYTREDILVDYLNTRTSQELTTKEDLADR